MAVPVDASTTPDTDGSDTVALSFGTWRTPNASEPVKAVLELDLDPGSSADADVEVDVDESGGTTADYTFQHKQPGGTTSSEMLVTLYLPPGASFQIRNVNDPDGNNKVDSVTEWVQ